MSSSEHRTARGCWKSWPQMRVLASHPNPTEVVEVTAGAFVGVENTPTQCHRHRALTGGPWCIRLFSKKLNILTCEVKLQQLKKMSSTFVAWVISRVERPHTVKATVTDVTLPLLWTRRPQLPGSSNNKSKVTWMVLQVLDKLTEKFKVTWMFFTEEKKNAKRMPLLRTLHNTNT